jgi:TetR/AcrR family transcriptional regulator, transcriptional repressor for nem operon
MARPREFNEAAVLEAAVNAFWANGYEGTSTRDLVKETGLTQPSLYNAFGDKRELFRTCLDHYLTQTMHERIDRLESSLPPGQAIAAFFGEIVERSVADRQQRGCMLVNAAIEVSRENEPLREVVINELHHLEQFFFRCMRAAQENGQASTAVPVREAAALLLSVLLGVRVLARVTPQRAVLTRTVDPVLALLGLPSLNEVKASLWR